MFFKRGSRNETKVRRLRDRAARMREKGRLEAAAECYEELEALEPSDADWPKRAAECYRRLGRRDDAVRALDRSAGLYAGGGFIVKAIAVCKMAIAMDPDNAAIRKRLHELGGQRSLGLERLPKRASPRSEGAVAPADAPPTDAQSTERADPVAPLPALTRSIPPGAPLEAVTLNSVSPAHEPKDLPQPHSAPIYELDLDEVVILDEELPAPGSELDAEVRAAARELLPRTPLFSEVNERTFHQLIERVQLQQVVPGEVIVAEGAPADALYVIVEGRAEVIADGSPSVRWGELADGDFFGEIGLVSDAPRQRTVRALEPTQLLVVDRQMVSDLVADEPSFLRVLLRFIRERLVDRLMRTSELFAPFSELDREELVARFRFLEIEAGAVLIKEGERAEGLFVLLSGEAEVVRGPEADRLGCLTAGDVFGEMSLLTRQAAVGTVRTTRKSFALLMSQKSFTETIMALPHVLMYTSDLAQRRQAANAEMSGAESRLDLI